MKIRSQINLLLSVSAVLLPLAVGITQWTSAVLKEELAEMARIEKLIDSATHLRLIATETVLFHEPRSELQWRRKIADLRADLSQFQGHGSSEAAQLERIAKHIERANSSYARLSQQSGGDSEALGLQARVVGVCRQGA